MMYAYIKFSVPNVSRKDLTPMARTFILISIPEEFGEKLAAIFHNVNLLNENQPIKIEEVYVATPKEE